MAWKDCFGERLSSRFYHQDTETVARELIGKLLLRFTQGAWIGGPVVETEAYLSGDDPASHSARGKTKSNASMFDQPGVLYVYPIHAKYCLNAVTESPGRGCAVLIRAIEPMWGVEAMQTYREKQELKRLTTGPAMLCQALDVDRKLDGVLLTTSDEITLASGGEQTSPRRIVSTPRIGISKAKSKRLRFVDAGSGFLSRKLKQP